MAKPNHWRIPQDLHDMAHMEAKIQGMTFAEILEKALVDYLEKQVRKRADQRYLLWRVDGTKV